MRVAAVQHDIVWEDREATLARLAPRLASAAGEGAELLLLAETFAVGFSLRTEVTAEPVDGPTSTWMAEQAAALGAWVGGSVPERAPGAELPQNVFVLAGPRGERVRCAKRHLFRYGGEDRGFAPGDSAVTVELEGVRCTLVVCYDLRFGDELWERAPDPDCYLVVASWPQQRQHHLRTLLLARAIENQAYVVGVNRVGRSGDGIDHVGGSCIVGPRGELLADAEPLGPVEATLLGEVDPAEVARVRARYPFLEDRGASTP
jgi:predicted amidohydrolase